MAMPQARIRDLRGHPLRTEVREETATTEAATTLPEKEGGSQTVKRKTVPGTGRAEITQAGATTVVTTTMMTQDGDNEGRHRNDATTLPMGRCLMRTVKEREKRLRLHLCPGQRQICNYGLIQWQMLLRLVQ